MPLDGVRINCFDNIRIFTLYKKQINLINSLMSYIHVQLYLFNKLTEILDLNTPHSFLRLFKCNIYT